MPHHTVRSGLSISRLITRLWWNNLMKIRVPDRMPDWLVQLATISNPCRALEQFQKLNLPAFKRKVNSIQAGEWLHQIEKILYVMKCTENQKVSFTSFMFQGAAEHWWKMVKSGAKLLGEEIFWNFQVKKFKKVYIRDSKG